MPSDEILEIVDRETRAWNTKDIKLLLSIFHEEMVWVWPKNSTDHNPMNWSMGLGKFDYERWHLFYSKFFDSHDLLRNDRTIQKVDISAEGDGAFAIVDIDTLWRRKENGREIRWQGRVCKVYSRVDELWKMTMHTGPLQY